MLGFLAAAALLSWFGTRPPRRPPGLTPLADRPPLVLAAPSPLDNTAGWTLAEHRGQVILINYWATWCVPCQAELPGLIQLSRNLSPRGLSVLGISLDAGPGRSVRVRQFAARWQIPYPIAFPPDSATLDSGPMALPTTLLIDRHGRLARIVSGATDPATLARDLDTLLAES